MSSIHDDLEQEYEDLQSRLGDQDLIADQVAYAKAAKRYNELEQIVACIRGLKQAHDDVETAKEMLTEASAEDRDLLRVEIDGAEATISELDDKLRELLLPKDPNDERNVIVEIRGAEGGEEANLFARELFDMYAGYAGRSGWKLEMLGGHQSERGGYSDVTFVLKGDGVWSRMKHEGGPHRVQRVPVTESQGRVHTSSATVAVLPEADEIEVDIDDNDLQVDVYRASGPGGQSVNTTDSAVRITHKPTGIVVSMQDEKSQLQNKARALQVLRARILQAEQEKLQAEQSAARKGQTGGGGRSEKIRTYNFKENRVTDHRIGLTIYKLDRVLGGELDDVVDGLVEHERAEQLMGLGDEEGHA
ncbi:MAG: peptide chain release factor 1 [Acidimicrobiales bacterium]